MAHSQAVTYVTKLVSQLLHLITLHQQLGREQLEAIIREQELDNTQTPWRAMALIEHLYFLEAQSANFDFASINAVLSNATLMDRANWIGNLHFIITILEPLQPMEQHADTLVLYRLVCSTEVAFKDKTLACKLIQDNLFEKLLMLCSNLPNVDTLLSCAALRGRTDPVARDFDENESEIGGVLHFGSPFRAGLCGSKLQLILKKTTLRQQALAKMESALTLADDYGVLLAGISAEAEYVLKNTFFGAESEADRCLLLDQKLVELPRRYSGNRRIGSIEVSEMCIWLEQFDKKLANKQPEIDRYLEKSLGPNFPTFFAVRVHGFQMNSTGCELTEKSGFKPFEALAAINRLRNKAIHERQRVSQPQYNISCMLLFGAATLGQANYLQKKGIVWDCIHMHQAAKEAF